MNAVIYRRISTNEDKQQYSLSNQLHLLEALCIAKGFDVVGDFTDSASGKDLNRPGLDSALEMIRTGAADVLVVHSLSRLSRNLGDMCFLVDNIFNRATLVSLREGIDSGTPAGRLQISLLSSINAYEREIISERIKENLAQAKRQGVVLGRPKYGYNAGGVRTINREEMLLVKRVKALRRDGVSFRKMESILEQDGVVGRNGKRIGRTVLNNIASYDYGEDAA
jgi:DNA invertase Pin-like site-specific DNA recombinase